MKRVPRWGRGLGRKARQGLQLAATGVLVLFSFAVFFVIALIRNPRLAHGVSLRLGRIYRALLAPAWAGCSEKSGVPGEGRGSDPSGEAPEAVIPCTSAWKGGKRS